MLGVGLRRALVADDNEVSRRVLCRLLEQLGFATDAVADGELAVTALTQRAYDLILMDCQMPNVTGKEATLAIRMREVDGLLNRTPIVAVTGEVELFSEEECLAAGMDAYLTKPVSLARLQGTVQQLLGWFQVGGDTLPSLDHQVVPK